MFALVDCNNFYVSCEQVFNPKLIGKLVIALFNNDGHFLVILQYRSIYERSQPSRATSGSA